MKAAAEWLRFGVMMAILFLLAKVWPASYLFFGAFVPLAGILIGYISGQQACKKSFLPDIVAVSCMVPAAYAVITLPWVVTGYLLWAQWLLLPIATSLLSVGAFAVAGLGSYLRYRNWERLTR